MKKVFLKLLLMLLLPGLAGAQDRPANAAVEKHVRRCVLSYSTFDPNAFLAMYPGYSVIRRVMEDITQDETERRIFYDQDTASMMQGFHSSWLREFAETYQAGNEANVEMDCR